MGRPTYNTRLIFEDENDKLKIIKMMEAHRFVWNECSKIKFNIKNNSLFELHNIFYKNFRKEYPQIKSQIVKSAINCVLGAYRSLTKQKRKIIKPPTRKALAVRLDQRACVYKNGTFRILTLNNRVQCNPYLYPKLEEYLIKYKICDPLLIVKNNEIWICITFKTPEILPKSTLAVGVDLGIRNLASTSEGKLYRDRKFNGRKRNLRYLKRCLQSKGTKTAKQHLNKLKRKEHNISKNLINHLSKKILLDTKADVIVLENLKSIKIKKHKNQNKRKIAQISLFGLRIILTYKALLYNKQVITVSPLYTSQIDHRTGTRDGIRVGSRYIGKDGQILHADCNAACNIAIRSKHPCSISNYYAWQAKVSTPIVDDHNLQNADVPTV